MNKYDVTLYYHTSVTVTVEAEDEDEAISKAYNEVDDEKYNEQFVANCEEDDDPDVELVED